MSSSLLSHGPSLSTRRAVSRAFQRARASLRSEDERLREHFRGVLTELARADTTSLSNEQRANRVAATAALRGYAARGRFPRNDRFPGRLVPFFIDKAGTRCAVAHLVEATGDADVARGVRATVNNGLVREFASNPAIVAWARANGFTLAELARVQPSYCFLSNAEACFCTGSLVTQVAEATVTVASTMTVATVDATVTSVQGTGPLKVGDVVSVYADANEGDTLLVGANDQGGTPQFAGKLDSDDASTVETPTCGGTPPRLTKEDAVNALLAVGDPNTACVASLSKVDEYWGASQCDNEEPGGGCAIGSPLHGPFAFTALALGVAVWMQRRRARRARWQGRAR